MPASDSDRQRLQLIEQLLHLPGERLDEVECFLASLSASPEAPANPVPTAGWHHGPLHRISEGGTYIVTAATLDKAHFFRGAERLDYLQDELLAQLKNAGWQVEAWAVFSNHYHFIAHALGDATPLRAVLQEFHRSSALHVNQLDRTPGRQVWFQFWDTQLTYESSYLARLNYVHHNAVKHGLVPVASQYRWCSAAWFERTATAAQLKKISGLKTDRVHIEDDYDPL